MFSRKLNKVLISSAVLSALLTGCNSSSSTTPIGLNGVRPASTPSGLNQDVILNNNGCTQEYFQTILGKYSGTLELPGVETPRCMWDVSIEITGGAIGPYCYMNSKTEGIVTQLTFADSDAPDYELYQCLSDSGTRRVDERISGTYPVDVFPNLDNSEFPVELDFNSNSFLDRGPYFGDESRQVLYSQLFDGLQSNIVDSVMAEGDGSLTFRQRSGQLLGTLVKVSQ